MSVFSDRLRQLRIEKNIMQKQLAALLNITPRNYQRYETGEIDPPTSKTYRLAEYLDVSIDYLVGRIDEPTLNKKRSDISMKKATQPLALEYANQETQEYLKKEYSVSVPVTDKELAVCQADFDKAWNTGERTPVENFDEIIASMAKDAKE